MVIFNSYVKLPEGNGFYIPWTMVYDDLLWYNHVNVGEWSNFGEVGSWKVPLSCLQQ